MSQNMSLKDLERKAFRSIFQDGLWDMFLGALLLVMGFGPVLGAMKPTTSEIGWILVTFLAADGLVCLGFWAGKKFITTPRIGLVKFGTRRKARINKVRVALSIAVLLGIVMFVLRTTGNSSTAGGLPLAAYIWVAQSIIVFGLGAYFLNVGRFYIYGVLYALPVPLGFMLIQNTKSPISFLLPFIISAMVMITIGAVLFIRFLRDHPLPAEEL